MPWNDGIEGNVLEIAASNQSPLRVMAGPGTGKTFALMRKVARLLEQGVEPSRILLITFTRVSASDIDRELIRIGLPQCAFIHRGTLHSLCFRILNRQHVFEFTNRVPRPLINYEVRFLLEDLSVERRLGTYNDRNRRLHAFEAEWAREQYQVPGGPVVELDQLFQNLLNEWLRYHRAILLDELIPLTLNYLRSSPLCDERRQYQYILVDEYQDLNRAEQALVDILASVSNLTIVGDEDQAIYEHFRYAHPEGITEYHLLHPDTHDVALQQSRRCPPIIVDMANSLWASPDISDTWLSLNG
jgi:superfamily I DNA/RNA helicase